MCENRTSVSYFNEAVGESVANVPKMLAAHAEYGGALNWLKAVYPGVTDEDHQKYYVAVAENAKCAEAANNVRLTAISEGIVSTKDTWQG